ncbi:hypothetical protein D3C73_1562530 [compost metagenome]
MHESLSRFATDNLSNDADDDDFNDTQSNLGAENLENDGQDSDLPITFQMFHDLLAVNVLNTHFFKRFGQFFRRLTQKLLIDDRCDKLLQP